MGVKQTEEIGKGKAGPGRPKGVPNKTTAAFKEAVELAAQALGGNERLVAWAKEDPKNERDFWVVIYPKLAPLQVNHQGSVSVSITGRAADL
jgi:hypothetical protein